MNEKDERPFIKITLDYLDNPKIDALSDAGIVLHLSLMLRAAKNNLAAHKGAKSPLVDGKLSARSCETRGKPVLKELLDQGLLRKINPTTYELHDYVKHQTALGIIQKRSASGASGGHTKNHKNRHKFVDTCEHCQTAFEKNEEWLKHPDLTASPPK